MADKKQAFNDVKAILSKLDRSIDEARSRRLNGPEQSEGEDRGSKPIGEGDRTPEPTKPTPRAGNNASGPAPSVPLAAPQRRAGASPYGRAKAIRNNENNGPSNHWRSA